MNNKLRQLRKEANLSQEKLGQLVGVKKSAVALWEAGARQIPVPKLLIISQFLKCTPNDILDSSTQLPTIQVNLTFMDGKLMTNTNSNDFVPAPYNMSPEGLITIRINETISSTFRKGYIAYYKQLTWGSDLKDKFCVVQIKDKYMLCESVELVKEGLFNIVPIIGKPIKETPIDFIGEVIAWQKEEL